MLKRINAFFLICVFFLTSGLGCSLVSSQTKQAMQPITLEYWRVWDGQDDFSDIIAAYNKIHSNIKINYRKFRIEEYEQELVNAMAEDRGPDMFTISNSWVTRYQNKISPMPDSITMVYPVVTGTIKKEIIPTLQTAKSITPIQIKNNFVDVVYNDVVLKIQDETTMSTKEQIYGLPLALDTLALFYNRDLFNNAGIAAPPAYWNKEFQQDVRRLTRQDTRGQIIQSGAALGGGANVDRSSDILSVLMIQNGAAMIDDSESIAFDKIPAVYANQSYNPGLEALRFYADFANQSKEVYAWNKTLPNSSEMFIQGNLAMFLGYSYNLSTIRAQASKLNFGIAPLPQIEGSDRPINFANYWVETVSKKSRHINEAWDFIQFSTKAENVKSYLDKVKRPTALRVLVSKQLDDADIGVFASQVLTAKTWYHGKNPAAMEKIMHDMIDGASTGTYRLEDVIQLGADRVQQTIR